MKPRHCFLGLAAVLALAYVPMAILFTPWRWANAGPLAFQFSRPLLYAVYYLFGLAMGAHGLERGLLALKGPLRRSWRRWLALAACSLFAWTGLTALTMKDGASAPLLLQLAADTSFAIASAASLFFVMAACLRFGTARSRLLDSLARNAMGVYLVHYAPVVWFQYLLLGAALPAVAKATIVCVLGLLVSWAAAAFLRAIPFGYRLVGEESRRGFDFRAVIAGRFSPAAD
jgi:surface polysaccharide O-acyltransferase-like enzyme